jgi:RNA polymerase sigma-70 factor (ECF subfamily)
LRAEEAEDAAQEALVKVFAQASHFDREKDAIAWALGIAAWEIRTVRRRRQRRREEGLESILQARPDEAPSPEDAAIATSLDALLDGALASLSPHDEATLRPMRSASGRPACRQPRFASVERSLHRLRRALDVEPARKAGTNDERHDRCRARSSRT